MDTHALFDRISLVPDDDIVEISFEGLTFTNAHETNLIYDAVDRVVTDTGRTWYFLGCFVNCTIKPGAALQFGIRRRHAHVLSRGAVRYGCSKEVDKALIGSQTDTEYAQRSFATREDALQCIEEMKATAKAKVG